MTNSMTPTEQDKELRAAIVNYRIKCDYYLSDRDEGVISQEEYETAISSELDAVIELIIADRKRVALEARIAGIDEAHKEILEIVYAYTGGEGLENFCDVDDVSRLAMGWKLRRIAELKAQQEEV